MNHKIKKQNIFYFLKSQGIVREIKNSTKILETTPNSFFTELNINGLNQSSIYWQFQIENNTFLEPKTKKVAGIIIEQTSKNILRIVLIELKSKKVNESDIIEKFEKSISWIYLLLNLLSGKENQDIEVYGILIAQNNKKWNEKANLNIFNSTSIRYVKRSFFTENSSLVIDYDDMIKIL